MENNNTSKSKIDQAANNIEFDLIFSKLRKIDDINSDKYDGSYELVKKTVDAYKNVPNDRIDFEDIDAIYFMTIGTWKNSFIKKKEIIEKSHLPKEEKEIIKKLLDNLYEKASKKEYNHRYKGDSIGMFGTGFQTFNRKEYKIEDYQRFHKMCVDISSLEDKDKILLIAENSLKEKMKMIGCAVVSQILHCLKPEIFPIINGNQGKGTDNYQRLGIELENPDETTYYIINTKKIIKFRDDNNFKFKNFRVMDIMALQLKSEEQEENFTIENKINEELANKKIDENVKFTKYKGIKKKKISKENKVSKIVKRDFAVVRNALSKANFLCELDSKHLTFQRKIDDKNYTEAHHLIPMSYYDVFDYSIDIEENVVSLCCNCHREIHFGKRKKNLIETLYNARKKDLEKAGIKIELNELLKIY